MLYLFLRYFRLKSINAFVRPFDHFEVDYALLLLALSRIIILFGMSSTVRVKPLNICLCTSLQQKPKRSKQLNREVYLTKLTASINALPGRCYCPINFSCTAQYHHVLFFKQQYTHYVPNQFYNFLERENGVMSISFLKSGVAMF